MPTPHDDLPDVPNDADATRADVAVSFDRRVATLRGAPTAPPRTGPWRVVGTIFLVVTALTIVVGFASVARDNARVDRMKHHGIAVLVTVTNCVGEIGGSGSTNAGFVCQGSYSLRGTHYHETIGSMTTLAYYGTKVHAVADPAKPSTIVLGSALRTSSASAKAFVAPGLLGVVWLALVTALVRRQRRARLNS